MPLNYNFIPFETNIPLHISNIVFAVLWMHCPMRHWISDALCLFYLETIWVAWIKRKLVLLFHAFLPLYCFYFLNHRNIWQIMEKNKWVIWNQFILILLDSRLFCSKKTNRSNFTKELAMTSRITMGNLL